MKNTETNTQVKTGVVKFFNATKGYGFIVEEDGKDLFVHYTAIQSDKFKTLESGDKVSYSIQEGKKGLPEAINVSKIA